jgi:hypothetical protein
MCVRELDFHFHSAIHEIHIIYVDKVSFIHQAHLIKHLTLDQDAAGRYIGNKSSKVVLADIDFISA